MTHTLPAFRAHVFLSGIAKPAIPWGLCVSLGTGHSPVPGTVTSGRGAPPLLGQQLPQPRRVPGIWLPMDQSLLKRTLPSQPPSGSRESCTA